MYFSHSLGPCAVRSHFNVFFKAALYSHPSNSQGKGLLISGLVACFREWSFSFDLKLKRQQANLHAQGFLQFSVERLFGL